MKKLLLTLALLASTAQAYTPAQAAYLAGKLCPMTQQLAHTMYKSRLAGTPHEDMIERVNRRYHDDDDMRGMLLRVTDIVFSVDSVTDVRVQAGLVCQAHFMMQAR